MTLCIHMKKRVSTPKKSFEEVFIDAEINLLKLRCALDVLRIKELEKRKESLAHLTSVPKRNTVMTHTRLSPNLRNKYFKALEVLDRIDRNLFKLLFQPQ